MEPVSSPDIFGQLAQQETANQQHDQAAAQQNQGDIFSQIAANGGNVSQEQTPDTTGQMTNDVGNTVIVPKEGESFEDTMNRAVQHGKTLVDKGQLTAEGSKEVGQEVASSPKKVAATLVAAPAIGAAGAGSITGVSEATGAAARVANTALQPVKDAIVEELPYLRSSPALYLEHTAKQVVKWVAENPDKALSLVKNSALIGAAVKWLMSNASPE